MSTVDSASRVARRDVNSTGATGPGLVSAEGFSKALAERSEARAFTGKTPGGTQAEMLSFGTGRNRVNVWNEGGQVMAQRPNGAARALNGGEVSALRDGLKSQGGAYVPSNDRANAGRVREFAAGLPQPLSGQDFRRAVAGSGTPWVNTGTNEAGKTTNTLTMTPPAGGPALNVWKDGNKTMASLGAGPDRQLTQAERAQVKTRLAVADRELETQLKNGPPQHAPMPLDVSRPQLSPAQEKAAFEKSIAQQRQALAEFARGL